MQAFLCALTIDCVPQRDAEIPEFHPGYQGNGRHPAIALQGVQSGKVINGTMYIMKVGNLTKSWMEFQKSQP